MNSYCVGAAREGGFGGVWRQFMKDFNDTRYDLMTSLDEGVCSAKSCAVSSIHI